MNFNQIKTFLFKNIYTKLPFTLKAIMRILFFNLIEKRKAVFRLRDFPLMVNGDTYYNNILLPKSQTEGFFTQYFNEQKISDVIINPRENLNYKSEILYGSRFKAGEIVEMQVSENDILPFSIVNKNVSNEQDDKFSVSIEHNNQLLILENLAQNRFHYLPFNESGSIKFKCNYDYILGNRIIKEQKKKNKKKLVLNIFVDGLASIAFERKKLEEVMPHTFKFFNKGTIFENCVANGDWTVSSVPSIMSGLYATNHKLFSPNGKNLIGESYSIMSEYYQNENYLTAQFCANYGKSPARGYTKGFDRTIYKGNMLAEEIISATVEHITTFKQRDQFIWLSLIDLHHFLNLVPNIYSQINNSLELHSYKDKKKKSALPQYDEFKSQRYLNELQRIDIFLNILYTFIEQEYSNEELTISLCSDHGQPYFTSENKILAKQRTQVPFMVRDSQNSNGVCEDIIENIDILPTLLNLSDINFNENDFDGSIPCVLGGKSQKEFGYSESIYPNQTYQAVIVDETHRFYFESEFKADSNGQFKVGNFTFSLYNYDENKNEDAVYPQKVKKYLKVIQEHTKGFAQW